MKVPVAGRMKMLLTAGLIAMSTANGSAADPLFDSQLVTTRTPGHSVAFDIPLNGARKLYLVVNDGGDGFACDWADWIEPQLVGPGGKLALTELKWKAAGSQWGQVRINQNAEGSPLRVNGKPVKFGIGTHANSVIEFDLPAGYERFQGRVGLDNGGTDQGGGSSVRFLVYNDTPPATAAAPAEPSREPAAALAGIDVHEGLEATVFAAEPMLLSPTNIDIDHLGRVWVCEVVNYRHRNGERPDGDRILIFEDTDQDGVADKKTVFYQGRDIDTALGICVLGNRVIVSVAPDVFVFTDDDGDGKADRKESLFTKVGQPQHDHSTHAFLFGPDGKLYWNFGNTGKAVHDRDGNVVKDIYGNPVIDNGKPYFGGMPFRCNLDGSEFEVLAHNFRNNYEVTVDSFGSLWQSDNDDDGNRGVRINFVMEHGNYGYLDEMTGAGWREPRTGMHEEIPLRHWHLRDPGVVPNLLQTGQGSPTGICVYEGRLLPEVFWDQVLHCDAGPNVVRAYPATVDGAGFKARMVNIMEGTRDKWFRPSDVCVAPDGSLIVADWYDPGVGGHRMGDTERGRLFRIAPPGTPYKVQPIDLSTAAGAVAALRNPNLATRFLAWTALHEMQQEAESELEQLYRDPNPRMRARALWLLGQIEGQGARRVAEAIVDSDPNLRITGLRLARLLKQDVPSVVAKLVKDPSPQVRRECLVALYRDSSERIPHLWSELAMQYDGQDRWYLEALGIAATGQWDRCLETWLAEVGENWKSKAVRDIVWRSRSSRTPQYLAQLLRDPATPADELLRYLRAFDFQATEARQPVLVDLALNSSNLPRDRFSIVSTEALNRLDGVKLDDPKYQQALARVLAASAGTSQFVTLVDKFAIESEYPTLLKLAWKHPEEQLGVEAIRVLLARQQYPLVMRGINDADMAVSEGTVLALTVSGDGRAVGPLMAVLKDQKRLPQLRRTAVRGVVQVRHGADDLLKMVQEGQLDESLKPALAAAMHASNFRHIKEAAAQLFPLPPAKDDKPLPQLSELAALRGDASRGRVVFNTTGTCAKCHVVNGFGKDVGPNLSEIGGKLSRQAMFESILYPSAGISHNYENYLVLLENGTTANGIITTQNAESVSLKGADALVRTFKKSEIEEMVKQSVSLMPADLTKVMTQAELVDVVEYLTTLKKTGASSAAASE